MFQHGGDHVFIDRPTDRPTEIRDEEEAAVQGFADG